MKVKLAFASLIIIGCASLDGSTSESTTAHPSMTRTSGSEATSLDEAQRRIRDLETQVARNVSDYQRIVDVARRAEAEAAAARRRAEAEHANARPTPTPTPAPVAPPPPSFSAPMPNVGMMPQGMGVQPIGQNPTYQFTPPPYGVVNNTAWVGRPTTTELLGGQAFVINLQCTGGARYATVITTRDGQIVCPSIATAIVTEGNRQLCAIPAGHGWSAALELHTPGRHEFVLYYYRMGSLRGVGHLMHTRIVAGDTETYPNVEIP